VDGVYGTRTLLLVSLVVFILLVIPVFALVIGLSFFPSLGTSSFSFWGYVSLPSTLNEIENTLEFSIVSAVFTTSSRRPTPGSSPGRTSRASASWSCSPSWA
jgi:ABC-type sulfate transport system permease component